AFVFWILATASADSKDCHFSTEFAISLYCLRFAGAGFVVNCHLLFLPTHKHPIEQNFFLSAIDGITSISLPQFSQSTITLLRLPNRSAIIGGSKANSSGCKALWIVLFTNANRLPVISLISSAVLPSRIRVRIWALELSPHVIFWHGSGRAVHGTSSNFLGINIKNG